MNNHYQQMSCMNGRYCHFSHSFITNHYNVAHWQSLSMYKWQYCALDCFYLHPSLSPSPAFLIFKFPWSSNSYKNIVHWLQKGCTMDPPTHTNYIIRAVHSNKLLEIWISDPKINLFSSRSHLGKTLLVARTKSFDHSKQLAVQTTCACC